VEVTTQLASHGAGDSDHHADLATESEAAVHGAHKDELDDEENLQGVRVVLKGDSRVVSIIDGCHVDCACGTSVTVASHGGQDGSGEDGDAGAHDATVGAADELDRHAGDEDADEHAGGHDEHGQVQVGIEAEDGGPARSCQVDDARRRSIGSAAAHIVSISCKNKLSVSLIHLGVVVGESGKAHVGNHDAELDGHGGDQAADWDCFAVFDKLGGVHLAVICNPDSFEN